MISSFWVSVLVSLCCLLLYQMVVYFTFPWFLLRRTSHIYLEDVLDPVKVWILGVIFLILPLATIQGYQLAYPSQSYRAPLAPSFSSFSQLQSDRVTSLPDSTPPFLFRGSSQYNRKPVDMNQRVGLYSFSHEEEKAKQNMAQIKPSLFSRL
mmetsp:Transcript_42773/g.110290  ORF Transcript_42773/g.110290 Transcript_42773/m.110290 type:complete len:152 (-) Transcript_42773:1335-1790(-)